MCSDEYVGIYRMELVEVKESMYFSRSALQPSQAEKGLILEFHRVPRTPRVRLGHNRKDHSSENSSLRDRRK